MNVCRVGAIFGQQPKSFLSRALISVMKLGSRRPLVGRLFIFCSVILLGCYRDSGEVSRSRTTTDYDFRSLAAPELQPWQLNQVFGFVAAFAILARHDTKLPDGVSRPSFIAQYSI